MLNSRSRCNESTEWRGEEVWVLLDGLPELVAVVLSKGVESVAVALSAVLGEVSGRVALCEARDDQGVCITTIEVCISTANTGISLIVVVRVRDALRLSEERFGQFCAGLRPSD